MGGKFKSQGCCPGWRLVAVQLCRPRKIAPKMALCFLECLVSLTTWLVRVFIYDLNLRCVLALRMTSQARRTITKSRHLFSLRCVQGRNTPTGAQFFSAAQCATLQDQNTPRGAVQVGIGGAAGRSGPGPSQPTSQEGSELTTLASALVHRLVLSPGILSLLSSPLCEKQQLH